MSLPNNPQTRKEMYLSNMAGQGTALPSEPHTREEEYLDFIAKNGGGGGGTGDGDMKKSVYDGDLAVLSAGGIKAFVNGAIAGKVDKVDGKGLSTNDYDNSAKSAVDGLSTALNGKVDKIDGKGLSTNDYDDSAKAIVEGVTTALDAKQPKTLSEPIYVDGIAKFSVETAIDAVNGLAASNKSALLTKADTSQIAAIQDGQNIDSFGDVETALAGKMPDYNINHGLMVWTDAQTGIESLQVDYTSSVTQSSEKPITSGGVYTALQNKVDAVSGKGLSTNDYDNTAKGIVDNIQSNVIANTKLIKDTVGWSGKNKLPNKAINYSTNGITVTVNADKSVSLSGTANADTWITICPNIEDNASLVNGNKYILSGCPDGGSTSKYALYFNGTPNIYDYGEGIEFTYDSSVSRNCLILIKSGQNMTGKVFKPMIRDDDILDPTYEPYFGSTAFPRSEQAVLGVANILKNVATSKTENGVIFTVNTDGTISVTTGEGSATADTTLILAQNIYIPSGHDWYIKGCPQGGSASTYFIYLDLNASPYTKYAQDFGDGALIQNYVQTNSICYMRVRSGVSIPTPIIFKPQITTSLDTPYAPYAMTNRELTENKAANSVIASVENGNTSSQAYNVGDYFIRNNLICKANKAINAGETLVAGSTHSTGALGLFMNKYLILDGSYVQTLSNGSDLNDLSIGEARVSNTDAPSILNSPSEVTTSFFIITIQIWGSEYLRQILFARDTANIYTRVKASTWGNWFKIGLTQV